MVNAHPGHLGNVTLYVLVPSGKHATRDPSYGTLPFPAAAALSGSLIGFAGEKRFKHALAVWKLHARSLRVPWLGRIGTGCGSGLRHQCTVLCARQASL